MKRIYASLGVVAIGVATVHNVQGQADPSRAWSVAASLRGFYDDNVNGNSGNDRLDSFGFEVTPTLACTLPLEQNDISASYTYSYKWYEKAINGSNGHDDQTHTLAAGLTHTFSERLLMSVQDSFVIGQEPDVLRVGNNAYDSYQRISGDNIRNYGSIIFNGQVTRQFGIEVGYANALSDYADDTDLGHAALLNRLDHTVHVDGRWNLQRDTVGIIGYQFRLLDYTANLPISTDSPPLGVLRSSARNSLAHYGYVGLEHTFLPELTGNIRAGASYSEYYNSPTKATSLAPYFQSSLIYRYAQESNLAVGISHDQNTTDQFTVDLANNSITLDMETTVAYVSLTHQIIPGLFGGVVGTYQYSTFNGGENNGGSQSFYVLGVNLEYRINRHVSANVGYNYEMLDSKAGTGQGDFDRNRFYVGATFVY